MVAEFVSRGNGGIFPVMCALAQTMRKSGHEVVLFGCADDFAEDDCRQADVRFRTARPRWRRGVRYCPELKRQLRAFAPDLIHIHGIWNYPELAAAGLGIPYLISPHGMVDPWALGNGRWKKRLFAALFEQRIWSRAAAVHALCASEAESIRAFRPDIEPVVIPNGVELPGDDAPLTAGDGKKELLYLGRLHPKKGAQLLIPAFLKSAPADWRLIIAGWDQNGFEAELRKLAGGSPAVVFAGPLFESAKTDALRRCTAFVLPSYSEGLPMAVLEAWSFGKPALLTDFCNLPEGFASHAAFRLETTPRKLEKGLTEFFSMSPAQMSAMGHAGQRLVRDNFTWNRVAAELLDVYRRAVSPAKIFGNL